MQGIYEHERDNYKSPSCWSVTNDVCLPHFHSSIELVYVTEGELKATLNGASHTIKKNEILIVSSYTVHHYETEAYSEAIVLIVPLDFISSYNKLLSQNSFSRHIYYDISAEQGESELLHCIRIVSQIESKKRQLSMNVLKGYIYIIMGILIENVGLVSNQDDQNRNVTKDILIYLQNNYLLPISLEQLSKNFGYSMSRFSHIFNSYFGCTIAEYINTLRCRHASGLLIDDSVSIINAGMSSGFNSMRTFYRSFKRCYGMTPSEYRNSYAKLTSTDGNKCYWETEDRSRMMPMAQQR
jgi:AraC-like DNA-binding protein